eukprot:XP_020407649.1 uncharacterized protein LOC109945722 [Zea mays]
MKLLQKEEPATIKKPAEKRRRIITVIDAIEETPPLASASKTPAAEAAPTEATTAEAAVAEATNLEGAFYDIDKMILDMATKETVATAEETLATVPGKGEKITSDEARPFPPTAPRAATQHCAAAASTPNPKLTAPPPFLGRCPAGKAHRAPRPTSKADRAAASTSPPQGCPSSSSAIVLRGRQSSFVARPPKLGSPLSSSIVSHPPPPENHAAVARGPRLTAAARAPRLAAQQPKVTAVARALTSPFHQV